MTVTQLINACNKAIAQKKYTKGGVTFGVNPRVVMVKKPKPSDSESKIQGYKLIDFQEYITKKIAFK